MKKRLKWQSRAIFLFVLVASLSMVVSDLLYRMRGVNALNSSAPIRKAQIARKILPPAPYTPEGFAQKLKMDRAKLSH